MQISPFFSIFTPISGRLITEFFVFEKMAEEILDIDQIDKGLLEQDGRIGKGLATIVVIIF